MRRFLAAVLLPALFLACSSAPTPGENTEATTAPLVACGVGSHPQCDVNELTGKLFCTCMADVCNWDTQPPPPGFEADNGVMDVIAWAVQATSCPRITNANGTWADVNDPLGTLSSIESLYGVPCSTHPERPACAQAFSGQTNCCTYVWWPANWSQGSCAEQDTTGLCSAQGDTFVAIESWACTAPRCGQPGNGGCSTCEKVAAP